MRVSFSRVLDILTPFCFEAVVLQTHKGRWDYNISFSMDQAILLLLLLNYLFKVRKIFPFLEGG